MILHRRLDLIRLAVVFGADSDAFRRWKGVVEARLAAFVDFRRLAGQGEEGFFDVAERGLPAFEVLLALHGDAVGEPAIRFVQ